MKGFFTESNALTDAEQALPMKAKESVQRSDGFVVGQKLHNDNLPAMLILTSRDCSNAAAVARRMLTNCSKHQ
jgi:hypothetical protein